MLSARGRRCRALVTAGMAVLLVASSLWGSDDHFPFAPFRMYSRAPKATGIVTTPRLVGVTTAGTEVEVAASDIGLRPAELEGQLARFRSSPELLAAVAEAYESFAGRGDPELVALRYEQVVRRVDARRLRSGEEHRVVAEWERDR